MQHVPGSYLFFFLLFFRTLVLVCGWGTTIRELFPVRLPAVARPHTGTVYLTLTLKQQLPQIPHCLRNELQLLKVTQQRDEPHKRCTLLCYIFLSGSEISWGCFLLRACVLLTLEWNKEDGGWRLSLKQKSFVHFLKHNWLTLPHMFLAFKHQTNTFSVALTDTLLKLERFLQKQNCECLNQRHPCCIVVAPSVIHKGFIWGRNSSGSSLRSHQHKH